MFKQSTVLDASKKNEQAMPVTSDVEVTEKDLLAAASYLAALQDAYAKQTQKRQAYPIDERTDNLKDAMLYCQMNFFC